MVCWLIALSLCESCQEANSEAVAPLWWPGSRERKVMAGILTSSSSQRLTSSPGSHPLQVPSFPTCSQSLWGHSSSNTAMLLRKEKRQRPLPFSLTEQDGKQFKETLCAHHVALRNFTIYPCFPHALQTAVITHA